MAVEVLGILLASAGASYALRAWQRRREPPRVTLEDVLAEDAAVVMSVANHEAGSRAHPEIWPIHILYGLMQDEAFTAAIEKLGGDPNMIEERVLAELDRRPREHDEAARVEGLRVLVGAHGQYGRKITSAGIWAYLARTPTGKLVEMGELTGYALMFTLIHGMAEPPPTLPDRVDVHVVMRNDDYTTHDFVISVLREIFDMTDADAAAKTLQVHNEGRGIVGRFKAPLAAMKIELVRKRAREQMFPLWIAPEDC